MDWIILAYSNLVRPEIKELAETVFDPDELKSVQKIIDNYLIKSKRKRAILTLRTIVPTRPKRPLYYINYELKFLYQNSRWVVENVGSYLDLLVKELRLEIEGSYHNKPLGANISSLLRDEIDEELRDSLKIIRIFNKNAYVPSKHIYGSPNSERHYFSVADAILIVLCAVKLGELLKMYSDFVSYLSQDLCLPGHNPFIGRSREPDGEGIPFDFKEKLFSAINLWIK